MRYPIFIAYQNCPKQKESPHTFMSFDKLCIYCLKMRIEEYPNDEDSQKLYKKLTYQQDFEEIIK